MFSWCEGRGIDVEFLLLHGAVATSQLSVTDAACREGSEMLTCLELSGYLKVSRDYTSILFEIKDQPDAPCDVMELHVKRTFFFVTTVAVDCDVATKCITSIL